MRFILLLMASAVAWGQCNPQYNPFTGDLQCKGGSITGLSSDGTTITSTLPIVASSFLTSAATMSLWGLIPGTAPTAAQECSNGSGGTTFCPTTLWVRDSDKALCLSVFSDATTVVGTPWCGSSAATPVAGAWWVFGASDMATGSTAPALGAANRVHYYEIFVPSPGVTFSKLTGYTNQNAGDVGYVAWGVYDTSCALVQQSDTVDLTGSQQGRTWTFSPAVSLVAGRHILGVSGDDASFKLYPVGGGGGYAGYMANLGESASTYRYFYGSNASTTVGAATTLPAACGTRTAINGQGTSSYPAIVLH